HIVGDIDRTRAGARGADLAKSPQPAEAGIEYENRREACHVAILSDPGLPFSCFHNRHNPTVIPGWCVSTRSGISRFRVRPFEAPRNDYVKARFRVLAARRARAVPE